MRPLTRCLVILAIVVSASVALSLQTVANKPVASPSDLQLVGEWMMESGVNQGQPIPAEQVEGSRMIVRQGAMAVLDKDQGEIYRCVYDAEPAMVPSMITMTSTMPDRSESQVLGIYKIERDELTLCYALPGGKRPSQFKSTPGGKTMLFKFKRAPDPAGISTASKG